jgi:NAD-dependent DNA ligase
MPVQTFLKENFKKEDGTPYSNPRNLVAGKLNDKKASNLLSYCYYIRYGLSSSDLQLNKDKQLDLLNTINIKPVYYQLIKASDITEKYLQDLFQEWKGEFEIDGIIIEVNDFNLRKKLGRESGDKKNPAYARAFKGDGFEDQADTEVLHINYEVSKQGFLKPTISIKPVLLNGALVSNPTGNNYKFIVENKIGPGAKVRVIRSGMVIPKIVKVISPGKIELPTHCPICRSEIEWNETKVELVCSNEDCEGQRLKKIIAFFSIIGVDNMGEGVCEQLYEAGYNTIEKILKMSKEDMKELDRFGERKSDIVYNNIQKAITNIPLAKIQHASGCFKSLGSKKLELLTWANENTTINEIVKIDGFSETLAKNYLIGIKKFNSFISNLPVSIIKDSTKILATSDKYAGWSVVFTGVRDKDVEKILQEGGGEIGSGVSKKTTHLVIKEKGSGSSKEKKAEELGIKIFELEEFRNLI